MRLRPRLSFAAPLVVVVGCRRPIAEPEAPEPQDAATVASIQDAIAVLDRELAPDAAPPDAPPPPVIDCNAPGVHCNPPPLEVLCQWHPNDRRCPKAPCAPPANCNPPPPIGRIVKTEISNADVIVTLAVGSEQGLGKAATGYLIDASERRVPNGDATLIRVDRRVSIWRISHVSIDVVNQNSRIRVTQSE